MHQLKLKYRELNSQYAEGLTQPVFKQTKRSYQHIRINQHMDVVTQIVKNEDLKAVDQGSEITMNVSNSNEYMNRGETAVATRVNVTLGHDGEELKQSSNTETFQ